MTTVPKQIKAALALARSLPEEIVSQGYAVVTSLTGNPNFTNLPVDLNVLKAGLDTYFALIAEARDGGRKAMTARNKQGESVIRMLRQLAAHVEIHCKEDMNIFLSSVSSRGPTRIRRHSPWISRSSSASIRATPVNCWPG